MTLDTTKPVQTRDGRKARIVATDFNEDRIVAIISNTAHPTKAEWVGVFKMDGSYVSNEKRCDLINVPPKPREWWLEPANSTDGFYVCAWDRNEPGAIHVREVLDE